MNRAVRHPEIKYNKIKYNEIPAGEHWIGIVDTGPGETLMQILCLGGWRISMLRVCGNQTLGCVSSPHLWWKPQSGGTVPEPFWWLPGAPRSEYTGLLQQILPTGVPLGPVRLGFAHFGLEQQPGGTPTVGAAQGPRRSGHARLAKPGSAL